MGLKEWFLAIYLLASTKSPFPRPSWPGSSRIAPQTARTMRHKIMRAMARGEGKLMLRGLVEMDESYIGGKRTGPRGRGAEGKTPVAVLAGERA
ncbi:MAG: hypothetical protein AABZ63_06570 [Actinomycetota bacterium]